MNVRLEIFLGETLEAVSRNADPIMITHRVMEVNSSRSDEGFPHTLLGPLLEHFKALAKFLNQAKTQLLAATNVAFFTATLLMGHTGNMAKSGQVCNTHFLYRLFYKKFGHRRVQHTLPLFLDGTRMNRP